MLDNSTRFTITREEANLDRACDEAYAEAARLWGLEVLEIEFVGYKRSRDDHEYEFKATLS